MRKSFLLTGSLMLMIWVSTSCFYDDNHNINISISENENIYKMSNSQRNSLGIKSLPSSLEESLEALKSDLDYLKICFHNELIESHVGIKQEEIAQVGNDKTKEKQFMFYYDV